MGQIRKNLVLVLVVEDGVVEYCVNRNCTGGASLGMRELALYEDEVLPNLSSVICHLSSAL